MVQGFLLTSPTDEAFGLIVFLCTFCSKLVKALQPSMKLQTKPVSLAYQLFNLFDNVSIKEENFFLFRKTTEGEKV
jgi:hypothetical protein